MGGDEERVTWRNPRSLWNKDPDLTRREWVRNGLTIDSRSLLKLYRGCSRLEDKTLECVVDMKRKGPEVRCLMNDTR